MLNLLFSLHSITLQQQKKRVNEMHKIQDTKIQLDVGGKFFTTSITTLTRESDSMLASMFSGRFPIKKDENGRVFIDRDGRAFDIILNYLREGEVTLFDDHDLDFKMVNRMKFPPLINIFNRYYFRVPDFMSINDVTLQVQALLRHFTRMINDSGNYFLINRMVVFKELFKK